MNNVFYFALVNCIGIWLGVLFLAILYFKIKKHYVTPKPTDITLDTDFLNPKESLTMPIELKIPVPSGFLHVNTNTWNFRTFENYGPEVFPALKDKSMYSRLGDYYVGIGTIPEKTDYDSVIDILFGPNKIDWGYEAVVAGWKKKGNQRKSVDISFQTKK